MHSHVFPHLGDMSVDEVTSADIMTTLKPLWTSKHATARNVRQRISTVMRWAVAQGYRLLAPVVQCLVSPLPGFTNAVRPAAGHGDRVASDPVHLGRR